MKKVLCLLTFLLIFLVGLNSVEADDSEIELKPMSPARIKVEPGKVVTLSLVVINHSGTERNFSEELDLPSDWQVIIPTTSFRLGAYDQQVRLISLVVPANSPAGSYRIGYSLTSQDGRRNIYQTAIDIEVIAISTLESLIEEKPRIVIAGDEYTVKVRYMNKGNSRINLGFELKNIPDYPVEFTPAEMTLEPGASEVLTVTVKTDETLSKAIRHVLIVKAIDKKSLVTGRSDTILSEVIPTIAGEYGFYHRIPSQFKILAGGEGQERDASINSGLQLEFSGSGSIDEQGKQRVDLSFLTSNPFGEDFYQNTPDFEFRYANDLLDFNAGNRDMVLSTLTKRWSGYDNIKLNFHPNKHSIGLINPGKDEAGFYYGYQFADWLGMKANYLRADDGLTHEDLYSLQAEIKPLTNTNLHLEFASGDEQERDSDAYRVNLRGFTKNYFHYSLEKTLAAPDFFGAYNDLESTNGTFSFLIYDKLQTSFTYHNYRNNLDLDPAKDVARDEQTYLTNLSYYLTPQTAILLSLREARKIDRLAPPEYNNEERLAKLGFQHQFPIWRVQAFVGVGEYGDKLGAGNVIDFKTYNLNLNYTPNSRQTYLFFVNSGDENYALIPEINNAIGVKANLDLMKNYDLNLEYQKRNFLYDTSSGQDYLALDLTYTRNRFSLTLKASQLAEEEIYSSRIWSLLGAYLLPYNIPVSKRKEVSVVKGKVFNGENPERTPISNVVVKANGITVVTNEAGEFIFSALPPGAYWISIDESLAGLNLTAMEKLPLMVKVKKGETVELAIGMVSAAEVRGKAVMLTPERKEEENDLYVSKDNVYALGKEGKSSDEPLSHNSELSPDKTQKMKVLANTLIEFTNGEETFRQVTNGKGEFSFPGMRPGQWMIKAYDNSLPAHYFFEIAEAPLNLKPGEVLEFTFKAIPQIRSIQIVEEGSIGPGGKVVSTDRLLDLDELFVVEYYSSAKPSKAPWASLEEAGVLRRNYLNHDRYFTDIVYIVKKDETLTGIAVKFQVPLQRIIDLNYLGATGMVKANSVLIIPIPVEFIHVVEPNETLEEIAIKHSTTVEILTDLNSISESNQLKAGQPLVLPGR